MKMKFLFCLSLCLGLSLAAVDPSAIAKLGTANDQFGLQLLKSLETAEHVKVAGSRGNVFISPYSVSSVLAMLLAGGAEQTRSQIFNSLGFSNAHLSTDELFQSFHSLYTDLSLHSKSQDNTLAIANSIAIQKNYPILHSFMQNISTYFESQVFAEDFTKEAKKATDEINKWVNEKTHGKIQKLFDQDLKENTRLVLLNAIYFKGIWKTQFSKDHTTKAQFHLSETQNEEVQLMTVKSHFNYAQFNDGQLLELAYKDESLAMYIFLPHQDNKKEISETFGSFSERIVHLNNEIVNAHIPKFKFEQTYHLVPQLQKLGIVDAFSAKADFSNIDGIKAEKDRVLSVSDVVHKTFIEVNEEGSEAAAVTGGVINHHPRPGLPPPPEIYFRADHPFLFFIRDKQHGVTLFSGIVNKP